MCDVRVTFVPIGFGTPGAAPIGVNKSGSLFVCH
jgi:hypothetical protein